MQQGRWVSYIFKYRNNARCENAGFIKVQRVASEYRVIPPRRNTIDKKTDTARIQIGMKMYKRQACRCLVYLMYRPDGAISPKVRFLEEMHFKPEERDTITKRFELDWDSPLGDGFSFDTYDGLFFVCDDGEILAGMWDEYLFKPEEIKIDGVNAAVEKETKSNVNRADEGNRESNADIAGRTENSLNEVGSAERNQESETDIAGRTENSLNEVGSAERNQESETDIEDRNQNSMDEAHSAESNQESSADMADTNENNPDEADSAGSNETDSEDIAGTSEESINVNSNEENKKDYNKGNSCLDVCREMLDTFPRLPLFADSQFVECVKIVPHDIGRLAMSNWKLGINSFLSHGYYHYRYIMMGKVKFERREAYVIGVPGVYTNKEKYLANMFGFSIFIPAKRTKLMTGNFGYWISEILTE